MEDIKKKGMLLDILRGSIISIILSICFTLILSVFMHYFEMSNGLIDGFNIGFRALSLVLGIGIGIKHSQSGLLKGFIISIIYVLVTYIVFALIASDFSFGKMKAIDSVSNVIFGLLSGIIAVNLKSEQ